jgi:hypothetical protein
MMLYRLCVFTGGFVPATQWCAVGRYVALTIGHGVHTLIMMALLMSTQAVTERRKRAISDDGALREKAVRTSRLPYLRSLLLLLC